MINAWRNPPEWYAKKDYSYLRKLDAAGWLPVLQRCHALREDVDLSEWESIGEAGWTQNFIPAYIGPPAVNVVDKADQSTLHVLEKPALLVQISLRAPDGVIVEEFARVLQLARRTTPSPVKIRGSKVAPGSIKQMHFTGWTTHRIVELCEIEAWRKRLEEKKPRDADIGRWLFPSYDNPRKEVITARKTLLKALNLIPALSTQVAAVTSNSKNLR
jgi:hypothetical protein